MQSIQKLFSICDIQIHDQRTQPVEKDLNSPDVTTLACCIQCDPYTSHEQYNHILKQEGHTKSWFFTTHSLSRPA